MERPTRFEHNRWVGDKRDQRVHDLDHCEDDVIAELMEARTYLSFGPDTLPEARNRGYRPCRCPATRALQRAEVDIDAETDRVALVAGDLAVVVIDPLPPKRLRRRLGLALTSPDVGAAARPTGPARGPSARRRTVGAQDGPAVVGRAT